MSSVNVLLTVYAKTNRLSVVARDLNRVLLSTELEITTDGFLLPSPGHHNGQAKIYSLKTALKHHALSGRAEVYVLSAYSESFKLNLLHSLKVKRSKESLGMILEDLNIYAHAGWVDLDS